MPTSINNHIEKLTTIINEHINSKLKDPSSPINASHKSAAENLLKELKLIDAQQSTDNEKLIKLKTLLKLYFNHGTELLTTNNKYNLGKALEQAIEPIYQTLHSHIKNPDIKNITAKVLMVGTGWKDIQYRKKSQDEGTTTGCTHVHEDLTNNKENYYTIDIDPKYKPDIALDFTESITEDQLPSNQFDIIILERFPADLNDNVFKNINRMLTADGICIIHYTDVHCKLQRIFEHMQHNHFSSAVIMNSKEELRLNTPGIYIISKNEKRLKKELLEELKETSPQAYDFITTEAELNSFEPISTQQINEAYSSFYYFYAFTAINQLESLKVVLAKTSAIDATKIEELNNLIDTAITELRRGEAGLRNILSEVTRAIDKTITFNKNPRLLFALAFQNNSIINYIDPKQDSTVTSFLRTLDKFNHSHISNINLKDYFLSKLKLRSQIIPSETNSGILSQISSLFKKNKPIIPYLSLVQKLEKLFSDDPEKITILEVEQINQHYALKEIFADIKLSLPALMMHVEKNEEKKLKV